MADRGKHRVAPVPAPTKKQYAYIPCPRSEEVGTEFALQLLRSHHQEPPTPEKQPGKFDKRQTFVAGKLKKNNGKLNETFFVNIFLLNYILVHLRLYTNYSLVVMTARVWKRLWKIKFSEYEFKTRTLIVYLDVCECLSNERYFYLEWSRGRLMLET